MKYKKNTKDRGLLGEKEAVSYLFKKDFSVLEKNLRGRGGEVDIVAFKDGSFHFVEVKSDFSGKEGRGWLLEEKVNKNKIQQINKVACLYLERKGCQESSWCIDVISVLFLPNEKLLEIKMIENVVL